MAVIALSWAYRLVIKGSDSNISALYITPGRRSRLTTSLLSTPMSPEAGTQWTQARAAYPNRPQDSIDTREDDDPFTGGTRNAGDNLFLEASPRKRTGFVFSRPLVSASASATPTKTQLSNK
ncbi:hypothetical protein E4U47_007628 [Claviceps purpurea]|nr:hypothetical protein E4U47_007628 [Claviceps purpurea]